MSLVSVVQERNLTSPDWGKVIATAEPARRVFLLDPALMAEAASYVDWHANRQREQLAYITGIACGPLRIPTRLLKFKTFQDPVAALDHPRSSSAALARVSAFDHHLLIVAHSHMPDVPYPSDRDLLTIRALAEAGYEALGVVFSDQILCFFSAGMDFEILLAGRGLTALGKEEDPHGDLVFFELDDISRSCTQ